MRKQKKVLVHEVGDPTKANLLVNSGELFTVGNQCRLKLRPGEGHYLDNIKVQHISPDPDGGYSIPVEKR